MHQGNRRSGHKGPRRENRVSKQKHSVVSVSALPSLLVADGRVLQRLATQSGGKLNIDALRGMHFADHVVQRVIERRTLYQEHTGPKSGSHGPFLKLSKKFLIRIAQGKLTVREYNLMKQIIEQTHT